MAALYSHIIPEIDSWPIFKLSEDRTNFVNEIVESVMEKHRKTPQKELEEVLSKTIFLEIKRCKEEPWKVDPRNEVKYWSSLRSELGKKLKSDASKDDLLDLLKRITNRYAEEIVGSFKVKTFKRARKVLSFVFRRLLNSAAGKNHRRLWGSQHQLYERLLVKGPIEKVRSLAKEGTIIIVPTHFSNLDSILIGYAIDVVMGMPAFNYGAGLNLYDLELVAYFINRLGAYKVDRRKKNPIYLETLKKMSYNSIERGVNTLFFPGGTRSRSGELEQNLKRGLLGTVVEAQRSRLEKNNKEKIFVVPLILSYHFVLEGKFLIEQHLRKVGQEQYLSSKDAAKSYTKILKFLWDLFSQGSEIYVTLGEPMDVVGNKVDSEGKSYDSKNREIDVADYFTLDDNIEKNKQRESVYTKILSEEIVKSFKTYNTVLSSHVVAYTLFGMIREQFPQESIFSVVAKDASQLTFPYEVFKERIRVTQIVLQKMNAKGQLNITSVIKGDTDKLIETGISNMGVYHFNKPVLINEAEEIESSDLKLLYYYHNRLEHYELDKKVNKFINQLQSEEA
ncbi:1-acyl-sn-glycerol-3-phosphate acyltransferase [Saprospiraceae bacterium]|nr:1-acyl-sn-glycerol-3-phosphate acyltransferase [Saprospiraceae bacterium]